MMNDERQTPEQPPVESAEMSVEELAEAKQYGRQSLVCTLADKGSTWRSWR